MLKYTVITGTLQARTAVHIGSGEGNEGFDALLRRDAAGNLIIPGTAVAGALRGLLTRLAPRLFDKDGVCKALLDEGTRGKSPQKGCNCAVCQLFGDVEPSDVERRTEESEPEAKIRSKASRLLVFNAQLRENQAVRPLVRDGVGIDRATGAAARAGRAKFDLEILPKGTEFTLRMELRIPDREVPVEGERLLAAGLAEWQEGRAWLGGNVARGLGGFKLLDVQYGTRDLDDNEELMSFLRDDHPWKATKLESNWLGNRLKDNVGHIQTLRHAREAAVQSWKLSKDKFDELPIADRWAEWDLLLEGQGPLLTNDTTTSGLSGFDHAPLLAALGDWTKPVLAGSGLRGVLRSHAERIARTLVTHQAMIIKEDDRETQRKAQEAYFWEHCPACDPLARRPAAKPKTGVALECCDSLLRYQLKQDENREVRPDQLCLACQLFGSTRNGSRLIVEDAPYTGDGLPKYKMLDFLAIDRFTGGGAEHFKFDALALWKPSFRLHIFLDNYEEWEMGWLALVLRDLADGWLRVGFGAAKGFGKVTVNRQKSTLRLALLGDAQPSSVYDVVESYNLDEAEFGEKRRGWVKAFNDELNKYERPAEELYLPADSFFNERVYEVYGSGGGKV